MILKPAPWMHSKYQTNLGYSVSVQRGQGRALERWLSSSILADDLGSDTHIKQLMTAYNSSSRGPDTIFWPLQIPCTHVVQINS